MIINLVERSTKQVLGRFDFSTEDYLDFIPHPKKHELLRVYHEGDRNVVYVDASKQEDKGDS